MPKHGPLVIHRLFAGRKGEPLAKSFPLDKFCGMSDSVHPMKVWIDANSSQAKIARKVGCSEPYLSLILSGKREPSLGLAKRLSELTGGAVPIGAFAVPAEARP